MILLSSIGAEVDIPFVGRVKTPAGVPLPAALTRPTAMPSTVSLTTTLPPGPTGGSKLPLILGAAAVLGLGYWFFRRRRAAV